MLFYTIQWGSSYDSIMAGVSDRDAIAAAQAVWLLYLVICIVAVIIGAIVMSISMCCFCSARKTNQMQVVTNVYIDEQPGMVSYGNEYGGNVEIEVEVVPEIEVEFVPEIEVQIEMPEVEIQIEVDANVEIEVEQA